MKEEGGEQQSNRSDRVVWSFRAVPHHHPVEILIYDSQSAPRK